ncbi:MAG TPA: efflux RND transporter periplasmic adaptor subunit [Ramlibacter sp.]|nr:efflux RND transporter periplasmic adaptor subunit [Ramlibacter sp.]
MSRGRRNVVWLIALVAVTLAAALAVRGVAARRHAAAASAQATAPAEAVAELAHTDVARAENTVLAQGLALSGSLRAVNSAVVKARVAGELQGLTVREGDAVRAGQVVARIDPAESRARLAQLQEQADAARSQVEIAQRQFDNNRALVEQGFISRTALDASQSNLAAAQASHKSALAAADVARKSLDDTVLRAPIAGVVSQRLAQPGERVSVDGRVIEIVDLARLELEAALTPAESLRVRIGQQALLSIEGAAQPVKAVVTRINPSAQAASRSVLAYLAVDAAPGLRQGLFAQGTLGTGQATALAVPLSAVRTDKPAPYVQLVENGRVAHRAVAPGAQGERAGEPWVAAEGVTAGAVVIRGHVGALREGTAVRFTQGAESASSAPGPATTPAPAPAPRATP